MRFLSIDVGIKNLSFCFFEVDKEDKQKVAVLKWDNINLMEVEEQKCIEIDKKGICNKPAKFTKNENCYCLKHAKKSNYIQPIAELKPSFLNKQKLQQLTDLAGKYKLYKENKQYRKNELIELLAEFAKNNCLDVVAQKNASKSNLITIGKNIQTKFDIIFGEQVTTIDIVVIENQIGPIANKMKTIQGMLAQYFIMKTNGLVDIEFISATNKLKDFIDKQEEKEKEKEKDKEKMSYKDRKKLGVQTCLHFVSTDHRFKEWDDFVKQHSKKDDLSDCFLQGMWYLKNKI